MTIANLAKANLAEPSQVLAPPIETLLQRKSTSQAKSTIKTIRLLGSKDLWAPIAYAETFSLMLFENAKQLIKNDIF